MKVKKSLKKNTKLNNKARQYLKLSGKYSLRKTKNFEGKKKCNQCNCIY